MNWYTAQALMATAKDRSKGKPIGNNTRLWENYRKTGTGAKYSITLHGNEIVRIYRDGNEYSHAGWQTRTTKERLNNCMANHYVYQRNWVWYVNNGWENDHYEFVNGMFISRDGTLYESVEQYKRGNPMMKVIA